MLLKTGRLAILSSFAALALAAGLHAATPTRIKSTEDMNSRAGPVINPETAPGRPLFEQHCAMCHLGGVPKAPSPNFLAMLAPDAIVSALQTVNRVVGPGRAIEILQGPVPQPEPFGEVPGAAETERPVFFSCWIREPLAGRI